MQLRRDAGWECREVCGVKRGARCRAKGRVRGGRWKAERKTMRCVAGGGMGKGKNGVRNHFGRHFTNIVYIIKKMF